MSEDWLSTSTTELWLVPLSTIAVFAIAILVIRVIGLRSLSKMSGFDFVVTVALGSIVATVSATSTSLVNGALAFATLLAAQAAVALFRSRSRHGAIVDNEPVLLMSGSTMLDDAMAATRVTRHDVMAKLREANVTDLDQVLAVVLETTGDISVLHGPGPLDTTLLEGVRTPSASAGPRS